MTVNAGEIRAVSIALACRTFQISETCYRYERKFDDENAEIADWLVRPTVNRKTWGFGLFFCICVTSKAMNGTTSACTGFTASWS